MNTTCLSPPACSCARPHGPASLPVVAPERAVQLKTAVQQCVAARDQKLSHKEVEALAPNPETAASGRGERPTSPGRRHLAAIHPATTDNQSALSKPVTLELRSGAAVRSSDLVSPSLHFSFV